MCFTKKLDKLKILRTWGAACYAPTSLPSYFFGRDSGGTKPATR